MKAIRVPEFGEPEVMEVVEIPDPEPGPGQVTIRVHAVGVNPVETYLRSGLYTFTPPLPYTPGADAAGEVEAVGEEVTDLSPGDRVYTAGTLSGAYAEKTLCAEKHVFPLPEKISFAQGAALGIPYGTAHRALFHRAKAREGETVLIHGASGGVGIAAIQFAKAAGLVVVGTAGSEEGERLVADQGADHVLNHHDSGHLQAAHDLTEGRGLDIILEMLANVNLGQDLPMLGKGGRVVVIGSRGAVEITPRDLMTQDADVLGMSLVNLSGDDRASIHSAIREGLEAGSLRPVVSRELPLAQAIEAHHAVIESSTYGKIVLIP